LSGFFKIGKQELLARVIPDTAGVWIVGVNTDYEFNDGQTEYSLIEPFVILPAQQLTSVTFTDGVLDADDPQWIAAGAGALPEDNIELLGVVIFFALDDAATLFAFVDGPSVGLPQTLTGLNVTGRIDPQGILRL
jgi:hypothetical protein